METLQQKSSFKVDRIHFAGSFGKKTNVQNSDVDCVYFLNGKYPPFDDVLLECYNICKSSLNHMFNIKLNKNSLNFVNKKFEMDVVFATNFVNDLKKNQSLPHIQQKYALERIREDPAKNGYKYSAALAEASVYFMKTRVGFANEMARICKWWFKNLVKSAKFDGISGANTFIELLAVYAARKGHRGKRKVIPHLRAYLRFLELIMKFETLNIAFSRCNPVFREHPPGENVIPRVIDPVNPYNNFTDYWSPDAIEALKDCASATYQQLRSMIVNGTYSQEQMIERVLGIK